MSIEDGGKVAKAPIHLSLTKKLCFSLVTTGLFLAGLEALLGAAGWSAKTTSDDPFVGFEARIPLFVRDAGVYRTNQAKQFFFNDQRFPVTKPPNTVRIFCLGGSTTYGRPYSDATSYVGWLREYLRGLDPSTNWEVVNCGGISYASYRIRLLIDELAGYAPDLFVVYTGHNEFLEERTYGKIRDQSRLYRLAYDLASRTNTFSLLRSLLADQGLAEGQPTILAAEVQTRLETSVGPSDYHRDDELKSAVLDHFTLSINEICQTARASGVPLVFVLPASNLRTCRPFKSEYSITDPQQLERCRDLLARAQDSARAGQMEGALELLQEFVAVETRFADAWRLLGQAQLERGQTREAASSFLRAKEEDVCPLRAFEPIRLAIRAAAQMNGVSSVDFSALLADRCRSLHGHAILGDESFLDHVHPTIEAHRLLSLALLDELKRLGFIELSKLPEVGRQVVRNVESTIDRRMHARALRNLAEVLNWSGKHDEALVAAERAEQQFSGLAEVSSIRARILRNLGRNDEAFTFYREAVDRGSTDPLALAQLGQYHVQRDQLAEAKTCFVSALRHMPADAPVHLRWNVVMGLGAVCERRQEWPHAAAAYQSALKLTPDSSAAHARLGAVLLRLNQFEQAKRHLQHAQRLAASPTP